MSALQPILDQAASLGTKAGAARAKGDENLAKSMRMALGSLKAASTKDEKIAIERAYAAAYHESYAVKCSGDPD
jgi:hypothetical protein